MPLLGDVNRDGVVNILDLVLVASSFAQPVPEGGNPADVNEDGIVNIVDLVKVAGALGGEAAAPAKWSFDLEDTFTRAQIQEWLSEARQFNLTDATAQRGILYLEQLLAALTPKETALLPNYPNPFNPETWIPYQLSEPADVTVTIYAVDGTAVRTLALGHQPIGTYQGKSRAAYWDGRNEFGEPVASGVYFYTLTAGDFTATRKMLIRK
ncbi:T9SS type A sorting domain-containing protein [Candidatus Poribacteria bacterium]|nr:T9SS type A sorting domain-containing protein [Candidatus Poribacteria bacterium]MYG07177.1 T9SS type A sorting domain-containing protein [Candidatus Poribacteria bacterium]MYK22016.1 T9SS type A sorting domain-containing protein [Candidatus Poribacteria bacterium]